eukprot:TRINITY_DN16653_c0_g1_i1.p1 TRINITY_DN16653_c0_g1~~TRINITY_DN16653_c0_g1_i1.p1  ORF type:complete len:121 (-),score=0.73 TRINITY_DN16653_c0_g1_i1:414-776(-)
MYIPFILFAVIVLDCSRGRRRVLHSSGDVACLQSTDTDDDPDRVNIVKLMLRDLLEKTSSEYFSNVQNIRINIEYHNHQPILIAYKPFGFSIMLIHLKREQRRQRGRSTSSGSNLPFQTI